MQRWHYVVLAQRPSADHLQGLAEGYRLFREARTGLYYLTAYPDAAGNRPCFAGSVDREITHRVDLSALERFRLQQPDGAVIGPHDVNPDLIQQAASLAAQLGVAVLVVEETDDEYAMAAQVEGGALTYLRFRAPSAAQPDHHAVTEVIYRPKDGFRVEVRPLADGAGLAPLAISEAFGTQRLRLFNYAEPKPSAAQAKRHAGQLQVPVQAYLDSFGVFRRMGEGAPRIGRADQLRIALRYAGSVLALPFIIVATVALALYYSGKPRAEPKVSGPRLFWLGLAIVAVPVVAALLLLRAATGE